MHRKLDSREGPKLPIRDLARVAQPTSTSIPLQLPKDTAKPDHPPRSSQLENTRLFS